MGYKVKQCVGAFIIVCLIMFGLYACHLIASAPYSYAKGEMARVEVFWTGAPCIDVVQATGYRQTVCGGTANFFGMTYAGESIGVDPIMGDATSISCTFYLDGRIEYFDLAVRGDGTDVNCILDISYKIPQNGRFV